MATNIITSKTRSYRGVKPPVGSSVNCSHPLSKGLVGCWLMNEGGGNKIINYADQRYSGTMSASLRRTPYGISNYGSDSVNFTVPKNTGLCNIGNYTVLCKARLEAGGVDGRSLYRVQTSNPLLYIGLGVQAGVAGVANKFSLTERDDSGSGLGGGGGNTTINGTPNRNVFGATKKLSTGLWTFYFNGKTDGTYAGSITSVIHTAVDTTPISFFSTGSSTMRGDWEYIFIWNNCLSPSEIQSLYESPYQFIAPARKIRYITPGVGGETPPVTQDATVTPNAIVSRFFVSAVTVTATSGSESATITATAIKASFVAPAVVVQAIENATITATAIPVSITAPTVTVSTGGNAAITATAIKTSFIASDVTVEATKNAVAVATAAAVRFLANTVTIATTSNTAVSVTAVSIKFVAGVATVQAIRNATIDATSAYAQFLVNSATIVISGVDSGITEVIFLSSHISKRLHEKSRISKRLNEVSRIDKTLLLDSPIH